MRGRSSLPSRPGALAACYARRYVLPFALPPLLFLSLPPAAAAQDNGSLENESFGNGVAITVVVHDPSGEPINSPVMVRLVRGGTIPSGQAQTDRGRAEFVVNNLGDFTVIVQAPGFAGTQKEISIGATGRAQVDVYLRRPAVTSAAAIPPGRPLLSPKAAKALDASLHSLATGKLSEAEKHAAEVIHLAPSHPDTLYLQGLLFLQKRDWAQAQTVLEKAVQIDPNHAQALAALGMALCDQKKFAAAIAPLEKSLQLSPPGTWDTRWTLARAYYQHQQYDQSLQMSEEALAASNGRAPEIALLVAQSLTAVGRYGDAAQTLRAFLRDHSDFPEAATARRWLGQLSSSGKLRTN